MKIILYINNEEKNVLNKTLNNDNALILDGYNRTQLDLINPIMELQGESSIFQYNYCYIPELKRYYFIDKIIAVSNNRFIFNLSIDVLKTYENQVKELSGEIIRTPQPEPYKCDPIVLDTMQEKTIKYSNPFNFNGTNVLISVTSERNV